TADLLRVLHLEAERAVERLDRALVADLAAGLRVERARLEHERVALLARVQRGDAGLDRGAGVVVVVRRARRGQALELLGREQRLERALGAARGLVLLARGRPARRVDREPALARHQLDQV